MTFWTKVRMILSLPIALILLVILMISLYSIELLAAFVLFKHPRLNQVASEVRRIFDNPATET